MAGPGKSPRSGGWPLAAGFLMDKAHRTDRLSLSSGKGHPGLCPAGGGHPCNTHQAPSLPRDFIFTSVKCKKTKSSYRAWKFTGGLHWSVDNWHERSQTTERPRAPPRPIPEKGSPHPQAHTPPPASWSVGLEAFDPSFSALLEVSG